MEWERVYVFISSTFNDMHAERDLLVKRVFPRLRTWCRERRIQLLDIDLRWGISKQDAEENKRVVEVCLNNIDRCRPFFISFLGQRQGWVPGLSDISEETLQKFPRLREYIGKNSVTELEIIHALLMPLDESHNPVRHARIYARDDECLKEIRNSDIRNLFGGRKRLFAKDPVREFRRELSRKIPVIPYNARWNPGLRSPELSNLNGKDLSEGRLENFTISVNTSLEEDIIAWLEKEIADEFPDHMAAEEKQSALDEELSLHDAVRFQTSDGYFPRPEAEQAILEYIHGNRNVPMAIHGAAGAGKTSLLSHFITEYRGTELIYRYCAESLQTSSSAGLIRSILEELKEKGLLEESDLAYSADTLALMTGRLLEKASAEKKILFAADGIDQLSDAGQILTWLPQELPENVRFIITLQTSSPLCGQLRRRNTVMTELGLITDRSEQEKIIHQTLSQFLKDLDEQQTAQLLDMKGSSNPLFLYIILNELRQHGSFETLAAKLSGDYGETPETAFDRVLERLENEMIPLYADGNVLANLVFHLLARVRQPIDTSILANILAHTLPGSPSLQQMEDLCQALFMMASPFLAMDGNRVRLRYPSLRRAAENRWSCVESQALNNMLANGYDLPMRSSEDLSDVRNFLYFTLRGREGTILRVLCNPDCITLLIRKLGSLAVSEMLDEAEGESTESAAALSRLLRMSANRLDIRPETIFIEAKRYGDTDDPLIAKLLAHENNYPEWKYLFPQENAHRFPCPERRLKRRRTDEVLTFGSQILTVTGSMMILNDAETFRTLACAPVSGMTWQWLCDGDTVYRIQKNPAKKIYQITAYSSQTLMEKEQKTIASDENLTFHAHRGHICGCSARKHGNACYTFTVRDFNTYQDTLSLTVNTQEKYSRAEEVFVKFLFAAESQTVSAGPYFLLADKEKERLRIFRLKDGRCLFETVIDPLSNLRADFLDGILAVSLSSTDEHVIRTFRMTKDGLEPLCTKHLTDSISAVRLSEHYVLVCAEPLLYVLRRSDLSDVRIISGVCDEATGRAMAECNEDTLVTARRDSIDQYRLSSISSAQAKPAYRLSDKAWLHQDRLYRLSSNVEITDLHTGETKTVFPDCQRILQYDLRNTDQGYLTGIFSASNLLYVMRLSDSAPVFAGFIEEKNLRLLNACVYDDGGETKLMAVMEDRASVTVCPVEGSNNQKFSKRILLEGILREGQLTILNRTALEGSSKHIAMGHPERTNVFRIVSGTVYLITLEMYKNSEQMYFEILDVTHQKQTAVFTYRAKDAVIDSLLIEDAMIYIGVDHGRMAAISLSSAGNDQNLPDIRFCELPNRIMSAMENESDVPFCMVHGQICRYDFQQNRFDPLIALPQGENNSISKVHASEKWIIAVCEHASRIYVYDRKTKEFLFMQELEFVPADSLFDASRQKLLLFDGRGEMIAMSLKD